ncbi:pilus (MSHA type) biogenesis protein MshL [Aestuariibacter sp. A3R04]|uniref:pilus (MSHA type) biogenesis protein MshL n=1 Tax=Aestuariibacter sp. A3R04 TaxID=2841571 RepID=UPI001C0A1E17|nr:pilus (MSHA type) biogenesis protein MshL [Aestuariibacter sp. A3R04]MBU3020631.1 pilus (MSHA type) biogenesis protein MshL [Aestuariibacter sp. A3R04]
MRRAITSLITLLLLTGCQSTENESVVARSLKAELEAQLAAERAQAKQRQALEHVPDDVSQALAPPPAFAGTLLSGPEKYDINAKNVDVNDFFAGMVEGTPYSVAVHPEVTGTVSLSLKQVSLDEVMSLISDLYGYDIQRQGNVFRVLPAGMRTETFAVNYLLMKRDGATQTSIISGGVSQGGNNNLNGSGQFSDFNSVGAGSLGSNSGLAGNSNGTTINTRTETNFWEDLQASLAAMLGTNDGRAVFVTPQAGLVTVRALPSEIRAIKHFLQVSEQHLQRQVVLEARILEVVLSDGYQQGINWNEIIANVGSTDLSFSTSAGSVGNNVTLEMGGVTSLSFLNRDFSGVLSLLSTQGDVQVLSSPRVTATNNQKAVIKVGDDEYFVTDVSSQNTITATTTSVVPDIELTPFFSGIALDVTPQIDEKGSVLLHVHPSVIETEEQTKVVTLNEEEIVLPLAQSTIRESDTIIRASSGEIVVIGGLMQTTRSSTESKTPVLGDIPVLGNMFKNRREEEVKKELVILLKPTVVEPGTWSKQIEMSRAQMADWLYVE